MRSLHMILHCIFNGATHSSGVALSVPTSCLSPMLVNYLALNVWDVVGLVVHAHQLNDILCDFDSNGVQVPPFDAIIFRLFVSNEHHCTIITSL